MNAIISKPSAEGISGRGTGRREGNAIGTNTGNGGGSSRNSSSKPQQQRQQLNPRVAPPPPTTPTTASPTPAETAFLASAAAAAAVEAASTPTSSFCSAIGPAWPSTAAREKHCPRPSPHSTDGNCGPASAPTATAAQRVRLRRPQLRPCVCAVAVAARISARMGLTCC